MNSGYFLYARNSLNKNGQDFLDIEDKDFYKVFYDVGKTCEARKPIKLLLLNEQSI